MTDLFDDRAPAFDSARSNCGSVNPPRPKVPICKNARRDGRDMMRLTGVGDDQAGYL
jgi:hypothetical protein